jgi:hypothetical protein
LMLVIPAAADRRQPSDDEYVKKWKP